LFCEKLSSNFEGDTFRHVSNNKHGFCVEGQVRLKNLFPVLIDVPRFVIEVVVVAEEFVEQFEESTARVQSKLIQGF
jgi:hypothetical protein